MAEAGASCGGKWMKIDEHGVSPSKNLSGRLDRDELELAGSASNGEIGWFPIPILEGWYWIRG